MASGVRKDRLKDVFLLSHSDSDVKELHRRSFQYRDEILVR